MLSAFLHHDDAPTASFVILALCASGIPSCTLAGGGLPSLYVLQAVAESGSASLSAARARVGAPGGAPPCTAALPDPPACVLASLQLGACVGAMLRDGWFFLGGAGGDALWLRPSGVPGGGGEAQHDAALVRCAPAGGATVCGGVMRVERPSVAALRAAFPAAGRGLPAAAAAGAAAGGAGEAGRAAAVREALGVYALPGLCPVVLASLTREAGGGRTKHEAAGAEGGAAVPAAAAAVTAARLALLNLAPPPPPPPAPPPPTLWARLHVVPLAALMTGAPAGGGGADTEPVEALLAGPTSPAPLAALISNVTPLRAASRERGQGVAEGVAAALRGAGVPAAAARRGGGGCGGELAAQLAAEGSGAAAAAAERAAGAAAVAAAAAAVAARATKKQVASGAFLFSSARAVLEAEAAAPAAPPPPQPPRPLPPPLATYIRSLARPVVPPRHSVSAVAALSGGACWVGGARSEAAPALTLGVARGFALALLLSGVPLCLRDILPPPPFPPFEAAPPCALATKLAAPFALAPRLGEGAARLLSELPPGAWAALAPKPLAVRAAAPADSAAAAAERASFERAAGAAAAINDGDAAPRAKEMWEQEALGGGGGGGGAGAEAPAEDAAALGPAGAKRAAAAAGAPPSTQKKAKKAAPEEGAPTAEGAAAVAAAVAAVDAAARASLPATWAALEVKHFKAWLKHKGLAVSGTKGVLAERVRAALVSIGGAK